MSVVLRFCLTTCLLLQGCSTTLHGYESSAGGVSRTGASTTVEASGGAGSTRAHVGLSSQGNPVQTGGQAAFSRGASLLIFFGLLSAAGSEPRATDVPRTRLFDRDLPVGPMPTDRISETCSCYGYVPPAKQ